MFFGRFLLFSILLYNTEAGTFDEKDPTARTYPDILRINETALPDKNPDNSTNLTEPYDGSRSFNNETVPRLKGYEVIGGSVYTTNQSVTDYDYQILNKTRTPYYSNSDKRLAPTEGSGTTSTRRSYYSYWGNKNKSETTTSKSYYNWYNRTTTTPVKQLANVTEITKDVDVGLVGYRNLTVENRTLTAHFPDSVEKLIKTIKKFSETIEKNTTARTPYYRPFWGKAPKGLRAYTIRTTIKPYTGYWRIVRENKTTTTRRPYYDAVPIFCKNGTSGYAGGTEYNPTTTKLYDTMQTTTARVVTDHKWSTGSRSSVEVKPNPSVNTNETRYFGALAEFLKKLSGAVLPSTGNKAPKSNITNIAIANENGTMFFYMNNYF